MSTHVRSSMYFGAQKKRLIMEHTSLNTRPVLQLYHKHIKKIPSGVGEHARIQRGWGVRTPFVCLFV